jgi:hypothetical protein
MLALAAGAACVASAAGMLAGCSALTSFDGLQANATGDAVACAIGSLGCACTAGGGCDHGLACNGVTCVAGSSTSGDAGVGSDADAVAPVDAGPDCSPPVLSSSKTSTGPTCGAITCPATSETCCVADNSCVPQEPVATECDGGIPVECEVDRHCPGAKCCISLGVIVSDPTCGFLRAQKLNATICESACAPNEKHSCQTQADCATGTCTPIRALGRDFGACL